MHKLAVLNDALQQLTGRRLVRPQQTVDLRSRETEKRSIYAGIAELRSRDLEPHDRVCDLRTSELSIFSQNGEDGVLNALIRHLGVRKEFFVEFGCGSGSECNTRLLAEVYGWAGLYIEPDARAFSALEERHSRSQTVACLQASVTPENVNNLFASANVPESLGVLSIDVDGQDYWIWRALVARYEPAIVVIECNAAYPHDSAIVESAGLPWRKQFGNDFGASINALEKLGLLKGYQLVHVDLAGVNAFFVRSELLATHGVELIGVRYRAPNYSLAGRGHPSAPARSHTTLVEEK